MNPAERFLEWLGDQVEDHRATGRRVSWLILLQVEREFRRVYGMPPRRPPPFR